MIDVAPEYEMSGDTDLLETNSQFRIFPSDESFVEHTGFHQQRLSNRSVGSAEIVL